MFKRLLSVLLTVVVLVTSLGLDQLAMTARAVTTYTTIYFKDETESHWVGNDGAVIEMVDNTYGHTSYMMKKLNSTTWSVKVPAYVFNVTFNRLSPSGKQWNSWSAGGRGKKRSDRSTWSSTYHTTVPEHGYWDGTAEFIEGFHEGDVIYLDYYEFQQWEIVDTSYYVNFTNAMKKHTIKIDEENVEEYKPILLTNEIEDMVYTYTVTAEDEGAPELRFWRGSGSELWNASVVLKYSDYLEGNNCVKVQGWTDTGYVCPYVPRRHVPVIDKTSLEVLGNKKVNRKIAINLDIQGETEYLSLEDTEINIQKLDSNGNVLADEKEENYLIYDTDATEWNHRELLFKQSGSYKVSTITYSRDKVDCYTTEEIINIVEDNAPVAEIDFVNADTDQKGKDTENVFVRNKEGKCNLKIKDQSVSEINDEITSREYKVFYDKNNDGKYSENEVMENVNGNKMEFTIALKKVGKYQVIETVKETFSDTIEKLLTEEDYLSGNVVVDFEIVNQAPVSSMDVKKASCIL